MKFLGKEIKLAIFDLDGTLIDSTELWGDIDKEFFRRRGQEVPPEYGRSIAHMGLTAAAKFTRDNYFPNENIQDMMDEWTRLSIEAYAHNIPLKAGAKEVLEYFYNNNVPLALATANSKELYLPCLKRLGIDKYFSFVIDVTTCKEGKSSPEIYDRTSEHFNVSREETVIFEDMILPMKTAYKAGYNVVGVYDHHSVKDKKEECYKHTHLYIDTYEDLLKLLK